MKKKYAIIVAGGSGTRMQTSIPKQFLKIQGKPIIFLTLEKFLEEDSDNVLIVVLPEDQFENWDNILSDYPALANVKITAGGKTRSESVREGLKMIKDVDGIVAIHDAVRPFVSVDIIRNSYKQALMKGSAVTSIPLKDSIRELTSNGNTARNRNDFVLVQTPQTFDLKLIKQAYEVNIGDFSDDATVFEKEHGSVNLISGSDRNIKITTKADLR
ncbi:MAG: 2-C-methyl-D-erythritol 4-phosphate cytidylyltransferase [Bacteroidota bacterium]